MFVSRHIQWNPDKCSNCMSCVIVCAERHTGMSAPERARIRIRMGFKSVELDATYCRQCDNAACAEACPLDAIQFDEQLKAWIVEEEMCAGCGLCEEACPYGAIQIDPMTGQAIKCDLCLGAVRCVEVCPTQALALVTDHGGA